MKTRSARCATTAMLMVIASAAAPAEFASAAEPSRNTVRLESEPPKPGADGWYDARPIDESFVVRLPGLYQAFTEDGKTEAGATTRTVGVRANVTAAFGGITSYVASCITQEGDTRTQKERLQFVVDHWEKLGLMRFRRPVESGSTSGYEFEISDDVKVIRARIYAPKAGNCTVLMSWRPFAKPTDADIDKYLASFELTKR